jgi:hypothetical protein
MAKNPLIGAHFSFGTAGRTRGGGNVVPSSHFSMKRGGEKEGGINRRSVDKM